MPSTFELCPEKRARRLLLRRRKLIADEAWIPECDDRGAYAARQCKSHKCVCVDQEGKTIFGQAELHESDNMTCDDAKRHAEGYLTVCERELVRARSLVYHFSRKGQTLLGVEGVACDLDGTFSRIQCGQHERCVCTDRDGVSLRSYSLEHMGMQGRQYSMDCDCARDEYDRTRRYTNLPKLSCDQFGSFRRVQHPAPDHCLCVEPDGSSFRSCPDLGPFWSLKQASETHGSFEEALALVACSESDADIYCAQPEFWAEAVCRWRLQSKNTTQ
ncbi:equistatin-like isoform X2 [Dermacentor silvarum]|uniref:equistatin-like isoform X2 n=1 Tax=Dermacentor silvarum TaxID=543639 RepID=UPI002101B55A|nr:equistatin-like isoform X2 [Dermacentor silvarum]